MKQYTLSANTLQAVLNYLAQNPIVQLRETVLAELKPQLTPAPIVDASTLTQVPNESKEAKQA